MKTSIIYILLCVIIFNYNSFAQSWKTYPYHQQGSVIYFPQDEGWHPSEPTEWWYTSAHVTGNTTGNEYSFMLTYFYSPQYGFDGFRIFNMSNETTGQFYAQTLACNYSVLSQDSLNIQAVPFASNPEEWVNLTDSSGNALPFEYFILASSQNYSIDVNYNTIKRPLMIGGTGFLYQGATGYTYYYSQTGIEVTGTLTFESITEAVTGTAWIDRQYGLFNPSNEENYEWFCFQLSNGMDLNVWNIFNSQNQIPDTSTYRVCSIYINDSTDNVTSDFLLKRLEYVFMPDSARCYSQKWHFVYNNIDLIISTNNPYNEVQLPFRFYEGSTMIEGTVGDDTITGVGFAELLHSFENPDIKFVSPDSSQFWNGSKPISWHIQNPDDGRPLTYCLEYSIDNKITFNTIVQGLTDTLYYWNFSLIDDSSECWFRVTGYSIDSTLKGTAVTDTSIILINTGIYEQYVNDYFNIYPNPSKGSFIIESKNIESITVTNIQGKIVKNLKLQGSETHTEIDLSNQPKGIYFVKIKRKNYERVKKIIVQ